MVGDVEEDSFVRFPDLGLFNCIPLLLSLGQVGYGVVDAFLEEEGACGIGRVPCRCPCSGNIVGRSVGFDQR